MVGTHAGTLAYASARACAILYRGGSPGRELAGLLNRRLLIGRSVPASRAVRGCLLWRSVRPHAIDPLVNDGPNLSYAIGPTDPGGTLHKQRVVGNNANIPPRGAPRKILVFEL